MLTKEVELEMYPLHPGQQEVMDNALRFNVLCCGRRWGKSTMAFELLSCPDISTNGFLNGFAVAYIAPTYKNMTEFWEEFVDIFSPVIKKKDQQERIIYFHGGGRVDFWSVDKNPDLIRGRKYKRVVVDEAAIMVHLKKLWTKVLRPTLIDFIGDAYFLSTPQGKNNYFYDLFKNEEKFGDKWKSFQFSTASNPHITAEEIEELSIDLDPLSLQQEIYASFIVENLTAWAYCFDRKKHVGRTILDPRYHVYLSFDFNKNPISCFVAQHHAGIRGIEMIKLPTSDIYKLCDYIKAKYGHCQLIVTGDATGNASTALVKDNLNYYMVIKSELNLMSSQFSVPTINPEVKQNRVLFNAVLHNRDFIVDEENCKGLIFDMEHAACLPNGDLDKTDRKDVTKQLDALDCCRYYFNAFHRRSIRE